MQQTTVPTGVCQSTVPTGVCTVADTEMSRLAEDAKIGVLFNVRGPGLVSNIPRVR